LGTQNLHSEQELVLLLKEKNARAFGYLYDNYSTALYNIIRQMISDTDLANDVLQEVFLNIWRKIETYDSSKGRLFTWMLNIARNASIDTLRSKSYQNNQKNQELPNDVNNNSSSFLYMPINIDNIGLRKILDKLKPEHRILIELAYFKGYTHEEIAQIENVPLGTVKTRIRNALLQLKEYLR
jgi:RNA polymerase sigma factor (sigma-70 family)